MVPSDLQGVTTAQIPPRTGGEEGMEVEEEEEDRTERNVGEGEEEEEEITRRKQDATK